RPARSTLFPYTTLFRSRELYLRRGATSVYGGRADGQRRGGCRSPPRRGHDERREAVSRVRRCRRVSAPSGRGRGPETRPPGGGGDRKSTRLNSSHEWIP